MIEKDTLFHINWGDDDNFYVIAPDEKTAKEKMPDGQDMVNSVTRLDALYQRMQKEILKAVGKWLKDRPATDKTVDIYYDFKWTFRDGEMPKEEK